MSTAGSFEPMDQRLLDYVGVDSEKDLPAARLVVDPAGPLRAPTAARADREQIVSTDFHKAKKANRFGSVRVCALRASVR